MLRKKIDVSEKNTKKQILDAYEELISQVSADAPVEKTVKAVSSSSRLLDTFQSDVRGKLDGVSESLRQASETIIEQVRSASLALEKTIETRKSYEQSLKEEEDRTKKQRLLEREEYEYDFSKRKKRQEEELKEQREVFDADIRKRREALNEQEKEIADLRKRADTFDALIATTEKKAVEDTTKALELTHKQTVAFLTQEHKATEQLLKQKVESLLQTITSQAKELDRLQKELATTNDRLTRIAEKAVTKEQSLQPLREKMN